MGTIFTLDNTIKSTIQDALDDLITELGKTCKLVYPAKMVDCPNCVFDPVAKRSANIYQDGGPHPFSNGQICPYCDGQGKRLVHQEDEILLLLNWSPKTFEYPLKNLDVRMPYEVLQTKCYLTDFPKLKRAEYLIAQVPIQGYVEKRFKLMAEPTDVSNIIQNRYIVSVWERT